MNRKTLQLIMFFGLCNSVAPLKKIHASSTISGKKVINRQTKAILPSDLTADAQQSKLSIVQPLDTDLANLYKSYPDGSTLFPKNPDIANQFNAMIKAIQSNPEVIVFFRKIHLTALNELYNYLMKIYTSFNLYHPGCILTTDTPTADLQTFLSDEATYATTPKRLLMNHFINIIQSQFEKSVISYNTKMEPLSAAALGKILIQNDYSLDLAPFAKNPSDPTLKKYFDFLQLYCNFYQTFTSYLKKIDEKTGVNQYFTIAEALENVVHPKNNSTIPTISMIPEMFFFDQESLRSIQFIPFTSGTIPTTSKQIPWPADVVQAAIQGTTMNNHPIAYFKDAAGNITQDQSKALQLFVLTDLGPDIFEQELLIQPGWLNTQEGSLRILQACLGDCSQLVGMGILDETLEKILTPFVKKSGK